MFAVERFHSSYDRNFSKNSEFCIRIIEFALFSFRLISVMQNTATFSPEEHTAYLVGSLVSVLIFLTYKKFRRLCTNCRKNDKLEIFRFCYFGVKLMQFSFNILLLFCQKLNRTKYANVNSMFESAILRNFSKFRNKWVKNVKNLKNFQLSGDSGVTSRLFSSMKVHLTLKKSILLFFWLLLKAF